MRITRLILGDYRGRNSELLAKSGERVFAYHPKHSDSEDVIMFPQSEGVQFQIGGSIEDMISTLELALPSPVDKINFLSKGVEEYEPLLRMSTLVGDNTEITSVY